MRTLGPKSLSSRELSEHALIIVAITGPWRSLDPLLRNSLVDMTVYLASDVHSPSFHVHSLLNLLQQHEPVGLPGLASLYVVFVSGWCLFDVELSYLLKSLSAANMRPRSVLFPAITCPDLLARFGYFSAVMSMNLFVCSGSVRF